MVDTSEAGNVVENVSVEPGNVSVELEKSRVDKRFVSGVDVPVAEFVPVTESVSLPGGKGRFVILFVGRF